MEWNKYSHPHQPLPDTPRYSPFSSLAFFGKICYDPDQDKAITENGWDRLICYLYENQNLKPE